MHSKADLREFIAEDRKAQPPRYGVVYATFFDPIFKLKTLLRKCEYHKNNKSIYHLIMFAILRHRFRKLQYSLGSEIGFNVFGKGLIIWHGQRIITNGEARVGDHCSISSGVVIGQGNGGAPRIGNNVELTINSTVIGGISIADNVRIGANALVVKDIDEANTTWGGVPARKISDRGTIEHPVKVS
ncbi:hypothetical protein EP30_02220 [Bifidobacterium sp. UTCIF-39]|nr:hypothetical protein EP30_02220 [Bifidobacterium sp. UTCIF-39]